MNVNQFSQHCYELNIEDDYVFNGLDFQLNSQEYVQLLTGKVAEELNTFKEDVEPIELLSRYSYNNMVKLFGLKNIVKEYEHFGFVLEDCIGRVFKLKGEVGVIQAFSNRVLVYKKAQENYIKDISRAKAQVFNIQPIIELDTIKFSLIVELYKEDGSYSTCILFSKLELKKSLGKIIPQNNNYIDGRINEFINYGALATLTDKAKTDIKDKLKQFTIKEIQEAIPTLIKTFDNSNKELEVIL